MKKQLFKTVFAAACLIGGIVLSPFKAKAQTLTDVTSTYLTNADMTSASGWTRTGTWDDTNISSGVSEAYGGWNSNTNNSYSCKQNVTLPKGVYKLTGYAFYRSKEAYDTDADVSLAYMVAGSVQRQIMSLSVPSRSGYPDSRTEASTAFYTDGAYLNTLYFTVGADNTTISIGYEGTHNSSHAKSWFIAGAMKLYKVDIASVSSSAQLDIDVVNAGFDVCVNGWAYTTGSQNHGRASNQSGDISGGYFENWDGNSYTGSIHQSQTLPNGSYTVKAAAFRDQLIDNASDGNAVYVFANDNQTLVSANDGTYYTVNTNVTNESLDYGVKSTVKKYKWMGIDNTTIKCNGIQLSYADALPSTAVTANKWYAVAIPSGGNYTLSSSASATITYTQDGTQLASNVTSTSSQSIDANGSKNLSLNAGSLYVKANAATTITVEVASYVFTPGQDITSIITNPGFESNGAVVNLSSDNLSGVTGWTLVTAANTNDIGTRAYSNATFASLNGEGDYCFNSYWEGKPLTQTLELPAGTYELSALVTTGNASSTGTVYLNAGNVHSTGFARKSGNANFYYRERLVFSITEKQNVTIGIRGGDNVADGAKKGAWVENGYWWYKCDDFRLKYIGEPTQANLYSQLQTLLANCTPWTSGDKYSTNYTTYSNYSSSNSIAELTAAISYLTNEYERYVLENATTSHPFDLGLIKNADYANDQTDWSTALNQTGGGNYNVTSDGTQTKFFQSTYNTHMRHSSIYQEGIILDEGIYRLSAKMKGTPKDDESTYIYATTGAVDHWGSTLFAGDTYYGYLTTDVASSWSTVNAYITLDAPATVRVGVLSWGNNWSGGNGGAFSVDDWKLEKISYAVVPKKGVVSAYGPAPLSDINTALTSDIGAVDLRKATGLSSAEITTTNNPNLLIYANSGQVSNSNNVVVDGQCSSLILTDSHPFINPTQFTATSASYTMSAVALGKNAKDEDISFGTLVLPFAATAPSGSVYALDKDINLIEGTLRGTAVSSIAANSPVLVTASGTYSGSGTVPVVAQGATYTNGELVGTYTAMTADEGSYVLQNHTEGEGVAFYLVGGTQPTVNPFRAYIKSQGSNARALKVVFDDAQGITNLNANLNVNGEVFDLQGRRVAQPTKGLYIVNGRKTVIK